MINLKDYKLKKLKPSDVFDYKEKPKKKKTSSMEGLNPQHSLLSATRK